MSSYTYGDRPLSGITDEIVQKAIGTAAQEMVDFIPYVGAAGGFNAKALADRFYDKMVEIQNKATAMALKWFVIMAIPAAIVIYLIGKNHGEVRCWKERGGDL